MVAVKEVGRPSLSFILAHTASQFYASDGASAQGSWETLGKVVLGLGL